MAKYAVNGENLASVADAIREKGGTEEPLIFPDGFVQAVEQLKTKPDLQDKAITPGAEDQSVTADTGYDGLGAVTVAGDADLIAANIKRNVEIFGVKGSYNGPSSSASTKTTAKLKINSDDYTVNGAPQTGLYMRDHELNETIALSYTGNKTFLHWLNNGGKILGSGAASVSYIHTAESTIVPVTLSDALPGAQAPYHAYIEFMSEASQVVGAGTWGSGDAADMHVLPKAPLKIGSKSLGWTLDGSTVCTVQDIINNIDGSFAYKEIRGLYQTVTIPITITIGNNLDDTTYTVTANRGKLKAIYKPNTGYEDYIVHYWSWDKEGLQPIGYADDGGFPMFAAYDKTVYIQYVPKGTAVSRYSTCVLTDMYPSGDEDDFAVTAIAVREIRSSDTVKLIGMLIAYGGDVEEETAEQTMVVGSSIVTNYTGTSTGKRTSYQVNNYPNSPDEVIWARGYVIYADADGVQHTLYSNVMSATWRELKAKDEEAGIVV